MTKDDLINCINNQICVRYVGKSLPMWRNCKLRVLDVFDGKGRVLCENAVTKNPIWMSFENLVIWDN